MKILSVGLNLSGGKGLSAFLSDAGITTKYFYDYDSLAVGSYPESLEGANTYLVDQYLDCDALVDMPYCFSYVAAYDSYPDAKFIYVKKDLASWIESSKNAQLHYDHETPFIFEEFFCNVYAETGKTKMEDLTEEELTNIYNSHDSAVTDFFEGKENFLQVSATDPEITSKLKTFLSIEEDVIFEDLFVI
jgi:hypothetical protein